MTESNAQLPTKKLIDDRLAASGVDVSDEQVRKVVEIALEVTSRKQTEETQRLLESLDEIRHLSARQNSLSRQSFSIMILMASVGIASAFVTLLSGYNEFVESLKSFFFRQSSGMFGVINSAVAQSAPPPPQTPVPLTPILVYGIYVLFAMAYVASFYFMFYGSKEGDKVNAQEVFRNLTAFFIGTISGKIV